MASLTCGVGVYASALLFLLLPSENVQILTSHSNEIPYSVYKLTSLQPGYVHSKGFFCLQERTCCDIDTPFFGYLLHMGHWNNMMWEKATGWFKALPFSLLYFHPSSWQGFLVQPHPQCQQHSLNIHDELLSLLSSHVSCYCRTHRYDLDHITCLHKMEWKMSK